MKIIVCKDYEQMSKKGYEVIKQVIKSHKDGCILGLATGSTPIGLYKNMIEDFTQGNVSYENIRSVNLDEYIGLPVTHKESYYSFMCTNLFNHINIDKKNVFLPNGNAENMQMACDNYSALLSTMQQDVQILGLGSNGHIGFNEPGTSFNSTTNIIDLKESTRRDNARFFDSLEEVPTQAITMGIANIMNAKKVVLLASGQNKAAAVKAMIEGEISENCPASVLQKHGDAVIILDELAASLLSK